MVLANGVFDLLHVAHLRHLEEARAMGDCLVVGLTRDSAVGKGAGRPVTPENERKELLMGLRCVSAVTLCNDAIEALEAWTPAILAKGHDRREIGLLPEELAYCAAHGIEIRYTRPNPQTTSAIIERIRNDRS